MPTDPIPDDQVWRDLADRNSVVEFVRRAGLPLDPWQEQVLRQQFAERAAEQRPTVLGEGVTVRRLSWWRRLRLRWGLR